MDYSQTSADIRNDRFLLTVLTAGFVVSLGLASWHDTWMEALTIGLLALGGAFMLCQMAPGSVVARIGNAVALMVLVALQIHQAHGMIELHFGVFVGLALLFCYRDWRPLLAGAVVIALHHVSFNALQAGGAGVYVFDDNRVGWDIVFIHAVYVVIETAALIWLAHYSREEARISREIIAATQQAQRQPGKLDLTVRCNAAGNTVLETFNHMLDQMQNVVRGTGQVAGQLINVMEHSATANQALANLSGNNLKVTEQIARAMEELSQSVQTVAASAQDTATSTDRAVDDNRICLRRVNDTQQSVSGLSSALDNTGQKIANLASDCQAISAVVDVIQGIAEQTNLLALNAAIEAARAGEQGRGFAVVADEVRALASRTYESTKEINRLIANLQNGSREAVNAMNDCQHQVQDTEKHSSEVVTRLSEINNELDRVSAMIQQIASAVEEQSAVSRDVSHNSSGIRQSSQQLSEHAGNSFRDVQTAQRLMNDLNHTLAAFRVD